MTADQMRDWLRTVLEDVATAPAVDTRVRHELLVTTLAPLGTADAERQAASIEEPAYWVRLSNHQRGDRAMGDALDVAAYLAAQAIGVEA